MKTLFPFISLFTIILLSFSAAAQVDFSKADSVALNFKGSYADAADLGRQLAAPFQTDGEKARALFVWVANTVRYDVEKFRNMPPKQHFSAKSPQEAEQQKAAWRQKEIRNVLKSKKGICQDYSLLYQEMCIGAGLECEIVSGDARDFYKPYRAVHDNPHAWNAVKIDGQWQLLDATWGAGYVTDGKFHRKLNTGYFMTPPQWFAQSHLPDDDKWQLLEKPVDKKTFPGQPMTNFGQQDYPLLDYSPGLERNAKGEATVRFRFANAPKTIAVVNGQSKKQIPSTQTEEDGWTVIRFTPRGRGDVLLFMGKTLNENMGWLARYDME